MLRLLASTLAIGAALVALAGCRAEAPTLNLPPASASRAEPETPRTDGAARPLLRVGEPVPAPILAGARHWQRGGAAGNRVLIATFTYTRCPESGPCAIAERTLQRVQDVIHTTPGLSTSVGILSLSVDPAFDVPAVLRRHADRIGADAGVWRFAALAPAEIGDSLAAFGVPWTSGAGIAPATVTLLIDAGGRLARVYSGPAWTAEELLSDLRSLVLRADPAVLTAYIDAQTALAADDQPRASRALGRLTKAVSDPAVARLAAAARDAVGLPATRLAFRPLSEALVRLPWPPEYQPMYCPMFAGNAGATWVQKAGPVTNPYLGSSMLRCGTDLSAGAHADHSAKFGGVLFMAADGFHHVEGTYTADGWFHVRLYDNFRKQIPVAGFQARAVLDEKVSKPLVPAREGLTLDVKVGTRAWPAEITLEIVLERGAPEERFDFVFASHSPGSP